MTKHSELRQDIVSGDWILLAPGRARYPGSWKPREPRRRAPVAGCPFENPLKTHDPVLIYEGKRGWEVAVIHNKYPAVFERSRCGQIFREGPYRRIEGVGYHNLVLTRHHDHNFAHLTPKEANQVFEAFRDRYVMLAADPCLAYVSIFHNWGPRAGASVYHPHYQIIAIPVVPPDVEHSLHGSHAYFKEHGACVHCRMIAHEKKERTRVIFENRGAIVVAPYVSREPFEVRVFPKHHQPSFANALDEDLSDVANALQMVLQSIERRLHDPDYNFFIHTAPTRDAAKHAHYHWHIEVIPKFNIAAGFELGTGIEINIVDPDEAARVLRKR
jgi:UDPglucose--hexose-1-phosphate uridylyltransferase